MATTFHETVNVPDVAVSSSDTNTFFGYQAGQSISTGTNNTVFGNGSGAAVDAGNLLTAVGYQVFPSYTSSPGFSIASNTGVGVQAGYSTTTGYDNVIAGYVALFSNTDGGANVAIGVRTQFSIVHGSNNTAVGTEAMYGGILIDQVSNGNFADSTNWTLGTGWSISGGKAVKASGAGNSGNLTSAAYIDYAAGSVYRLSFTVGPYTAGSLTVEVCGVSHSFTISGSGAQTFDYTPTVYSGPGRIVFTPTGSPDGTAAAMSITGVTLACIDDSTGFDNCALGVGALYQNTEGHGNVAVGLGAMRQHGTGNTNTAVGTEALTRNGSGSGNVALGRGAGFYETGSNQLFIDNTTRSSESDGRVKSLLYGVFDASVSNQRFRINGSCEVPGGDLYRGVADDGLLRVAGGASAGSGAAISLYGPSHSTNPSGLKMEGGVSQAALSFANGDTTPSVKLGNVCATANASPTTITQFDDGRDGQEITVKVDGNTTIQNNSSIKLTGGANFVGTADDLISLVRISGVWYEKCRSLN